MTVAKLEREIAALGDLSRAELIERWQGHYRSAPPKGISRSLLIRAVAYEMQARRFGGLRPATERRLRQIADGVGASNNCVRDTAVVVRPGARLIREWHGVVHVVDAIDGAFLWNGLRYRSLSAIARAITGARWSGPRFFGVASGASR